MVSIDGRGAAWSSGMPGAFANPRGARAWVAIGVAKSNGLAGSAMAGWPCMPGGGGCPCGWNGGVGAHEVPANGEGADEATYRTVFGS